MPSVPVVHFVITRVIATLRRTMAMLVTTEGVVYWKVPADQPPGESVVIITISDKSGQETFHTFRVRTAAA
jgi:hypothetical protein